jgi:hypothetical protein
MASWQETRETELYYWNGLAEQDCHLARVKVKGPKMPPSTNKFPVLVENFIVRGGKE